MPGTETATIAAIEPATARWMVSVVLSDGRRVGCKQRQVQALGIAEGMALFPGMLEELLGAERALAYETAMRRLARKERTEAELRQELATYGFGEECITGALERLRTERAIDDRRAAEGHLARRTRQGDRGRRLLQAELRARGVPGDVSDSLTAELDDDAAALEAARRRGGRASLESYRAFEGAVGPYLLRRGFGMDVARRAMRQVYEELVAELAKSDTGYLQL